MVPKGGFAGLSLRPARASAFAAGFGPDALPCVALFLLFVGGPHTFKSAICGKGGFARLSLRLSRAPAIAARLGADGLPCVALFFLLVSAPRRFKSPDRQWLWDEAW